MASGDSLGSFLPFANEAPSSSYMKIDFRNGHPVLDAEATSDTEAIFTDIMPRYYSGGSIQATIWVATSTATTGTMRWQMAFERMATSVVDLDEDNFASFLSASLSAPNNSGSITSVNIAFQNGDADGVQAGGMYRFKVRRDADGTSGTDDMAGDAEYLGAELMEL